MVRTFDPFREMDRVVNEFTRTPSTAPMPMDLYRDGDVFTAHIDLPGVDPDSIDIDVEERTLTIRAERKPEVPSETRRWLTRERAVGTYARQLNLGQGLALDKIEAGYADGVLTLTIPIAEQAKPRKIAVVHTPTSPAIEGTTVEGPTEETE